MSTIFKTTALAFATSSLLIAGCGGSSSDGGNNGGSTPQVAAKGKAVDFYLSGAKVTFDNCANAAAATTDSVGAFEYPAGCSDTALTVSGGIDIGTGLPFEGVLKAPRTSAGSLNIVSPLTTLIANDPTAAASLAAKLGLSGTNLLTTDPMTNAALLKQTVVVQQFIDQIQKTILQLSASTGGSLTAEQAASAASAALAASLNASSGATVDLTNPALAESAVAGAIIGAATANPSSLPFSGEALRNLAANTAAVTAATVAEKVTAVNNITYVAVPNATADSLKAAFGSQLDSIEATSTSPAASNLISSLATALTTSGVDVSALRTLGNAVANNSAAIDSALSSVNQSLPADKKIPDSIATDLQQVELYKNYLQLATLGLNGVTPAYNITAVESSVAAGKELTTTRTLDNVQVKLNKVGNPFQNNLSEARIGLSYTIGTNQLDLIIDKVSLTFDNSGVLIGAAVPLNASYSFHTSGAATVSGKTIPNKTADTLVVSNGAVNLPIDAFLNKVVGAGGINATQIENYRPKSGNTVKLKVALGKTLDTTVRVGTGTDTTAKAASNISISVDNATTPIVLNGQGVNAVISVK